VSPQAAVRTLFIALEAAFSCVFGTMQIVNKDYGISSTSLWGLTTLEYERLMQPFTFGEIIAGDFKLPAQQLELLNGTRMNSR
jgi:hypothetical protein